MDADRLTLLNAPVITACGTYRYELLSLAEASALVQRFIAADKPIQSAIGHQSTAELLTHLLEIPVAKNRFKLKQTTSDLALVFQLNERPPEGKVLSLDELKQMGYEFGLLTRLA